MNDELEQNVTISAKANRGWHVDAILQLFGAATDAIGNDDLNAAPKKHRLLDFIVSPGRISAKLIENGNTPQKLELVVGEFDENIWQEFFNRAAKHAYVLAKMLAGELCFEVDDIFAQMQVSLIPRDPQQIQCFLNNQPISHKHRHIVALGQRFAARLSEDPFALFVLRGCGHEELLNNLRRSRRQLKPELPPEENEYVESANDNEPQNTNYSLAREGYWEAGAELEQLSFSIKADELPAAILKWLDPLPLNGYEDEIERTLEESYAQVACRAHAFGLGL